MHVIMANDDAGALLCSREADLVCTSGIAATDGRRLLNTGDLLSSTDVPSIDTFPTLQHWPCTQTTWRRHGEP